MTISGFIMRILFILTLFFGHASLYGQNFISIEGHVRDIESDGPIAYSHITVKGSGLGTVANEDGQFIFKIANTRRTDSMQVSAIGFESRSFLIDNIQGQSDFVINLKPETKVLDEVLITPVDPEDLIREVVRKIPTNYGTEDTRLTGFYRETVKINDEYYSYLEGVIGAYKTGYDNENAKSDQVKIIKGRRRQNKIIEDSTRRPPTITSGPHTINTYDLVKRRSNFINEKKLKLYEYELTDITTYGGKDIYVVDFKAKKPSKRALAFGKLYIDMDSKVLLRADYEFNAVGVEALNKNVSNGKKSNFVVTAKSLQAVIHYDVANDKGTINQLRIRLGFDYYIKSLATTDYLEVGLHIITTDLKRGNLQAFTNDEKFRTKRAFAQYIGEEDPNFWENYNILKQDNRLKEAFSK
ncbi:MAG: carboxypeptidase-like regulatory domain-containing protein [Bacteroidota bacterium]